MLERPPPTNVQSHEWLLREQLRLRAILDTSHEAGVGMDADGRITDWNRQAEVLLGWSASEAMGQSLADLIIPPRYHAAHHAGMAHYQVTGGGPYIDRQMEVQALHREGHEVSVEMMLTVSRSGDDYTFFAFLQDVAVRKAAEQALIEQAMQDPLTGLDNRRAFMAHLSDAMRRTQRSKRPMALLYMDIDHFKSINDGLGHGVGDSLLKAFGARLKAQVRVVDRVARLGGDEFTVILEMLHVSTDAETVAAKLVRAMAERFELPGHGVSITTSIGLEIFEGDDTTPDRLIAHADQAMYRAKRSGRGTWRARDDDTAAPHPVTQEPTALAEFFGRSPAESQRHGFLEDALAAIRTHLGMDVAFISEFTEGRRVFRHIDAAMPNPPIQIDQGHPLEETYCQRVVDGRLPELIADALKLPEAAALSVTQALTLRAYLGVPIRLGDGRIYGTFCCFSANPDASLNDRDIALLRIFADLTARHIERHG